MSDPQWIDAALASKLLGVTDKHVVNLIRSRALDGYDARRTGSRRARWRIRRDSVFRFMNDRRPPAKEIANTPDGPD